MSDIPTGSRRAVAARCGARCEVCGIGPQEAIHHRQRRREGGHELWNLLAVDSVCHARIHAHPKWAGARGWIISAHAPVPALVPALIRGEMTWLTGDGGYRVI